MQALLQLQFSNKDTHTHTNIRDCQGITLVEIEIDKDLDAGPKWHFNQTWSVTPPMIRQSSASKMGPRCCRFSPAWTHEDFCPRT